MSVLPDHVEPASDDSASPAPIFVAMAADWMTESQKNTDSSTDWNSSADAGLPATRRAAEIPVEVLNQSGLPCRTPGQHLIPGSGTGGDAADIPIRNPESIRATLGRHRRGVLAGRNPDRKRDETLLHDDQNAGLP